MRMSRYFVPTLREDPKDAEVTSHKLMQRAGIIRKVASGIYIILPLGFRAMEKLIRIVREEMKRTGALELQMPLIQPKELWMESGRWNFYGKELLRFKDRKDQDFCLAPTHEEVITDLAKGQIRSYRQLPLILYQIHSKFRDEIRPRFGLMRAREFVMKDAYSFDASKEKAMESYNSMYEAYDCIFRRLGLRFEVVEADTGAIGGNMSHEFQVLANSGEDQIVKCTHCNKAWNIEKAPVKSIDGSVNENFPPMEKVYTGEVGTIEELLGYLGVPAEKIVKTLLVDTDKGTFAVLLRGDRSLSLSKLKILLHAEFVNLKNSGLEEIPVGQIGPIGIQYETVADLSVLCMGASVVGGNEPNYHMLNAVYGRDFTVKLAADVSLANEGDLCNTCGEALSFFRGIEVGQVFYLGSKYSSGMDATFLDAEGVKRPFFMGCYGIGIGRTLAAAIEQSNDEKGIIWPVCLAPFDIHIVCVDMKDERCKAIANTLYTELTSDGLDVLFDDREERVGVKFNDADLIGLPIRITIGKKTLNEGIYEVLDRRSYEVFEVKKDQLLGAINAVHIKRGVY